MGEHPKPDARVLITGATGFVGGWLASELASRYPRMRLVGTTHRHAGILLPPFAELHACDLTQSEDVRRVVAHVRPEIVFHLAGFASGAGTDSDAIRRVNVAGTVSLLQALQDLQTPVQVLLASSGYVYGVTEPGQPAVETDTLRPQGAYAESKKAMEEAAAPFAKQGDLSLTITRSFNHSGPRQTTDFVLPAFAKQVAEIERGTVPPVVRVGNLNAIRDFLHVRDVVRAYRLLVCDLPTAPIRIVNVGSGVGVTIQSLLDGLIAHARAEVTVEQDPTRMRPSDLPECVGSPVYLQELTGWRPLDSLETMLADTLAWWREQ